MHHLGVATTRALSLVATGESVERDMFYDGNAQDEPGAIVCHVAPSFVRFGNFEILAAHEELDELKALADYVIRHHYPELGAKVAVSPAPTSVQPAQAPEAAAGRLQDLALQAIRDALARSGGNISSAAREPGVSRGTLYRKLHD